MTTLSKEDGFKFDSEDIVRFIRAQNDLVVCLKADMEHENEIATLARAELVAENERLKEENTALRKAWNADQLFVELRTALAELLVAVNNYIPEADHWSDDGVKYYSELVLILDKHRK